jgi:hypothetical protein
MRSLVVLLLSCAEPPPASAPAGVDPAPEASTWGYDEAVPTTGLDVATAEPAAQLFIDSLYDYHGKVVVTAFREAMGWSTSECPYTTVTDTESSGQQAYWTGLCYGDEGMWYKGPMTTWAFDQTNIREGNVEGVTDALRELAYEGYLFDGAGIRGQTDIFSDDGTKDFNCSCIAMHGQGTAEDGRVASFSLTDGPAHWFGGAQEGTWLQASSRPSLWMWFETNPNNVRRIVRIAGGVTVLGQRYGAVRVALELKRQRDRPESCLLSNESTFTLDLRDATTATWHALVFDMSGAEDDCIACAPTDGGPLCVNLSGLLDPETAPW